MAMEKPGVGSPKTGSPKENGRKNWPPGVLTEDGKTWFPSAKSLKGYRTKEAGVLKPGMSLQSFEEIRDFLRPNLLVLTNCKKVLLDGPSFQNSPAWCPHTLLCQDLTVHDVHVRNPWNAANGDGIDIESCKNVLLENSTFDAGDDGICIKSGSEMSGGARNIFVYNCSFQGTDIGLRFKTVRGRGGVVEKIYVKNISMKDIVHQAIFLDMYYFAKPPSLAEISAGTAKVEIPPVTEATPQFRDIHISQVGRHLCTGAAGNEHIKDIYLDNMVLKAAKGVEITAGQHITLKNIRLVTASPAPAAPTAPASASASSAASAGSAPSTAADPAATIYIENSSDLLFDAIGYNPGAATLFSINGDKCSRIRVEHTDVTKSTHPVTFNYGAAALNFAIVGESHH